MSLIYNEDWWCDCPLRDCQIKFFCRCNYDKEDKKIIKYFILIMKINVKMLSFQSFQENIDLIIDIRKIILIFYLNLRYRNRFDNVNWGDYVNHCDTDNCHSLSWFSNNGSESGAECCICDKKACEDCHNLWDYECDNYSDGKNRENKERCNECIDEDSDDF